jgi:hypothetical protein
VRARALVGAAVAALLTAGLVAGSRVPWTAEPGNEALVRLSWRAVGERVEECRDTTAAERASLPPHMRQPRICERRLAPFRLSVRIDGEQRLEASLHASGAREDRPTYVLHEFRVAEGEHRIEVHFATEPLPGATAEAMRPLHLDARVALAANAIALVTRDGDDGPLVVR